MKLGLFSGESGLRFRLDGETGVAIDPRRSLNFAVN